MSLNSNNKSATLRQILIANFIAGILAGGGLLSYSLYKQKAFAEARLVGVLSFFIFGFILFSPLPQSLITVINVGQFLLIRKMASGYSESGYLAEAGESHSFSWLFIWGIIIGSLVFNMAIFLGLGPNS